MTNRTELTAERIAAAIRVVETEQKCVMRNADGYCDRQCEKCDLLMLVAEILGGYDTALAALRAEQERLNPQPLTWEELSGMVGEPVWTIGECCGLDGWDIIEEVYEDSILFGRSTEQPEKWRYNLRELSGELSGCAWLAYRTKPKEEQPCD